MSIGMNCRKRELSAHQFHDHCKTNFRFVVVFSVDRVIIILAVTRRHYTCLTNACVKWDGVMQNAIMGIVKKLVLAWGAVTFCGCAAPGLPAANLNLSIDNDHPVWQSAAASLNQSQTHYQISITTDDHDPHVFDRIRIVNGKPGICLAPRTIWHEDGQASIFIPAYCSDLDEKNPAKSLEHALNEAESRYVQARSDETPAQFRQRILAGSTPENPVCFGVFPDLFASAFGDPSVYLMESYLLECAEKIDEAPAAIWPEMPSSQMAGWLRELAALLSSDVRFVSEAFGYARDDRTREGIGLGKSIEAHIELLSRRFLQAEYTTVDALRHTDAESQHFVSRQNVERVHYLVETQNDMTGARLEQLIRSITPTDDGPDPLNRLRLVLQVRACQLAQLIPDVTASLVSACMPWLVYALRDADEYDSALLLIEHAIYGTPAGEQAISPDVMEWLKNEPVTEEQASMRHLFGQRLQNAAKLSESERKALSAF